ncbi:MAG TPA: YraN family protein [Bacteroides sp.]|nr:YraN family protein [Bacteroides sp.]
MNHCRFGKNAEQLTARYLITRGYYIWKSNWRWGKKELDLIAVHKGELVIVEVKSMEGNRVNQPWDVVDGKKQRHIVLAADAFIRLYHVRMPVRFDVIAVYYHSGGVEIEHIENAFYPQAE